LSFCKQLLNLDKKKLLIKFLQNTVNVRYANYSFVVKFFKITRYKNSI